ncbi:MAG: hypothetical protein M3N38_12195 [Pseudomonadota bacterium]|nr:hypothetical protein [Pseudomonadota bacterium]
MRNLIFVAPLALLLGMPGHDGIAASSSAQFANESYLTAKPKKKAVAKPYTAQKRSNFRGARLNCRNRITMTWSDYIRCGYDPPFWARNRDMVSD